MEENITSTKKEEKRIGGKSFTFMEYDKERGGWWSFISFYLIILSSPLCSRVLILNFFFFFFWFYLARRRRFWGACGYLTYLPFFLGRALHILKIFLFYSILFGFKKTAEIFSRPDTYIYIYIWIISWGSICLPNHAFLWNRK